MWRESISHIMRLQVYSTKVLQSCANKVNIVDDMTLKSIKTINLGKQLLVEVQIKIEKMCLHCLEYFLSRFHEKRWSFSQGIFLH